jgi:hypothetical protein
MVARAVIGLLRLAMRNVEAGVVTGYAGSAQVKARE